MAPVEEGIGDGRAAGFNLFLESSHSNGVV